MAEDNPDEIGRPTRAPDGQPAKAGELLAELVRLVDSPGFALKRPPPVEIAPEQHLPARKPAQARETKPRPPSPSVPSTQPKETAVVEVQPPEPRKPNASLSDHPKGSDSAARRRGGAPAFGASALVLGALAVLGSTFGLERMASKSPETPPSTAAAESPTPLQPPSRSLAAASDAAAIARRIAPPAEETVAAPEQGPIDLTAHDSLIRPPAPRDIAPATVGMTQPAAAPAQEAPAATINAPPVAEPATAPKSPDSKGEPTASLPPEPAPIAASKSPDSKAEPTAALPPQPAPTAASASSAADSGPGYAGDAPLPPVRPAPKAAVPAGRGIAQRSTTRLDSPTRLSSQSGAHVGAKAGASGPAAPDTKTAQASVEPQAAAPAQLAPSPPQPKPNPVARAFGSVMGAVGSVAGLIPFAPHQ